MRELTIDEKAKAFDEALERARNLHKDAIDMEETLRAKQCEIIFPELRESEDERIRKVLVELVKCNERCGYFMINNITTSAMLAWLEKQGEQRSKLVDFDLNANDSDLQEETYFIPDGYHAEIDGDKVVIKKGEPKPAGVEPKFKVGDWVVSDDKDVHDDYRVCKITKIDDGRYYIEGGDFLSKSSLALYGYRLWTIQDAKDGDVLSWDDSKCITLFKNIYDEDSFNSYGFVGHCTGTFESRQSYHDIKGAHPATKEQRDILFYKMHEAGFEWNADKKELKKINNTYCD